LIDVGSASSTRNAFDFIGDAGLAIHFDDLLSLRERDFVL